MIKSIHFLKYHLTLHARIVSIFLDSILCFIWLLESIVPLILNEEHNHTFCHMEIILFINVHCITEEDNACAQVEFYVMMADLDFFLSNCLNIFLSWFHYKFAKSFGCLYALRYLGWFKDFNFTWRCRLKGSVVGPVKPRTVFLFFWIVKQVSVCNDYSHLKILKNP
jgi:hypothetical protein